MRNRCIAMLLWLSACSVGAADYSAGEEAYDRGDYEAALVEWRALAEQGDARAQFRLGGLYEEGSGVEQDAAQALDWYRRAAERGHVEAQVLLGGMYAIGIGVTRDMAWAWAWFDRAASQGHALAAKRRDVLGRRLNEATLARAAELGSSLAATRPEATAEAESAKAAPDVQQTGADIRAPEPERIDAHEMVRIAPGCYTMGSDGAEAGRHVDEVLHSVCVEEFFISRHEVTRGQYAAFVDETGRDTLDGCVAYKSGGWGTRTALSWRNPGFPQRDDHPVACVSRHDALAYAQWISQRRGRRYRLPTEAEWEYAARSATGTARPWGNDAEAACLWANVGDHALVRHYPQWSWTIHACDDAHVHTAPVGSYAANGFGLHDMAGNVWEWTCSPYEAAYRGAESRCDPDGQNGVVRGGSWSNSPRWVRSAGRFRNGVGTRLDLVGFRLVHD